MGNTESSKKKQQRKELLKQMEKDSKKIRPFETKNILLLHKSNASQSEVVENFLDALDSKTQGTINVTNFVNITNESKVPKTLAWLNQLNNVVLICLTPESINDFRRIILEKGFSDQSGNLHSKVFTISFGEKLTAEWPPKGLIKGSKDLRDFHFGFTDVHRLRQQDFEKSLRLNSLIVAIKGADITDQFEEPNYIN